MQQRRPVPGRSRLSRRPLPASAEPTCSSNAACPAGAACFGGRCRVGPSCTDDADCAALFPGDSSACVEKATRWCRNDPSVRCTTRNDCPPCPDGGACRRLCEPRRLKFYFSPVGGAKAAELSDLFLDPDEPGLHNATIGSTELGERDVESRRPARCEDAPGELLRRRLVVRAGEHRDHLLWWLPGRSHLQSVTRRPGRRTLRRPGGPASVRPP